jgi:glycosyltransferase involved in cell wall biosynthesis
MSINFYIPDFDKNKIPIRASRRFRAMIPLRGMRPEDKIIGSLDQVKPGDIVVVAKKIKQQEVLYLKNIEAKVVYDICDSKWHKSWQKPYVVEELNDICAMANLIVTITPELANDIKIHTNKNAFIIPDPTERERLEPNFNPSDTINLFYYGSEKNFSTLNLNNIIDTIKKLDIKFFLNVMIDRSKKHINRYYKYIEEEKILKIHEYNFTEQEKLIKMSDIILLPIRSKNFNAKTIYQKSPNRVLDAIQMGKIVITNSGVASYEKLKDFVYWMYNENYGEAIYWLLNNREQVIKKITYGQNYIDHYHTPEVIGKKWIEIERLV